MSANTIWDDCRHFSLNDLGQLTRNSTEHAVMFAAETGEVDGSGAALPSGGGPRPKRRGHSHQPGECAEAGRRIGGGDKVSVVDSYAVSVACMK